MVDQAAACVKCKNPAIHALTYHRLDYKEGGFYVSRRDWAGIDREYTQVIERHEVLRPGLCPECAAALWKERWSKSEGCLGPALQVIGALLFAVGALMIALTVTTGAGPDVPPLWFGFGLVAVAVGVLVLAPKVAKWEKIAQPVTERGYETLIRDWAERHYTEGYMSKHNCLILTDDQFRDMVKTRQLRVPPTWNR